MYLFTRLLVLVLLIMWLVRHPHVSGEVYFFIPISQHLFPHEVLTLRLGEFFDGIAEHGPWHLVPVLFKEPDKKPFISFSDLTQHPADGFAHKVMS